MPLHKADQVNVVSDKVKLTKEQATVVKEYVEMWNDEKIIEFRVRKGEADQLLSQIPLDTLIRALYIGYEVEETPEEILLKSYKSGQSEKEHNYYYGYSNAIKDTINLLNIKVKGINE